MRDVEPERLLNNIQLRLEWQAAYEPLVAGDEPTLIFAIASLLRATFALLDGVAAATATLAVATDAAGRVVFTASQDAAAAPDRWVAQAFDPEWSSRPGGVLTLTALLALRQLAETHGGQLSLDATGRGTSLGLTLPAFR
jgi:hypothetical protein